MKYFLVNPTFSDEKIEIRQIKNGQGVPTVAQWDGQSLCRSRSGVPSPAQHSELRDLVLPQLWHGLQLWLGSDP